MTTSPPTPGGRAPGLFFLAALGSVVVGGGALLLMVQPVVQADEALPSATQPADTTQPAPPRPSAPPAARLAHPRLRESSGLQRSRTHPGVYWTLNDSGGGAELFAIGPGGEDLGVVPVRGVDRAVDWESIAADDAGLLYIGDTGDNKNRRVDLSVLVGAEPDPRAEGAVFTVQRRLRFRYPGRTRVPDPDDMNYDSEALFWDSGELFLLTKHRSDTRTVLYRFPSLDGGEEVELVRLGEFDVGGEGAPFPGQVTGAAVAPDGSALAVLTYHALLIFGRPGEGEHWLSRPLRTISFDPAETVQCEGVAWDADGVLFTNEERGGDKGNRVFRVPEPLHPGWARYPE